MGRWKKLLLPLVLLLAACGSESSIDQEPAGQPSSLPAQITATPAKATEEPSPEPQNTLALPDLTEGQAEDAGMVTVKEVETLAAATETAMAQPTTETPATEMPPTVTPPAATAAPEINGEYEGTYYRGLANAPITMIDYSDFL